MPPDPDALNTGPDLTDPKVVAALLLNDAKGLDVQAASSGARTSALAGHPYPEQFYRMTAEHLRAAAALLTGAQTAGPATAPAPVPGAEAAWDPGQPAPEKPVARPVRR